MKITLHTVKQTKTGAAVLAAFRERYKGMITEPGPVRTRSIPENQLELGVEVPNIDVGGFPSPTASLEIPIAIIRRCGEEVGKPIVALEFGPHVPTIGRTAILCISYPDGGTVTFYVKARL